MDKIDHATLRLKFWPSPQDYNEAVQDPARSFSSPVLQGAQPELDAIGLPRPVTGGFASVYHFRDVTSEWAVRCFLQRILDQEARYARISSFILSDDLPYTVDFEYIPNGIRVLGEWFPLLKMDWVDGDTLDAYIQKHCHSAERMKHLQQEFLLMIGQLNRAGIAHGDLQHGNIIVTDSRELRLVDYDGMFIPGMEGMKATELGHPNYQHPSRSADNFNCHLDNFSALVIHASLLAIATQPDLLQKLGGLNDCLIFRASDFRDPSSSPSFRELEQHGSTELRHLSQLIRSYLQSEPDLVPTLENLPQQLPVTLPPLDLSPTHHPKEHSSPAQASESSREWWKDQEFDMESAAIKPGHKQSPLINIQEPELRTLPPRRCMFNWNRSIFHPIFCQLLVLLIPHFWLFGLMPALGYLTITTVQGTVTESKPVESRRSEGQISYKYKINGREIEAVKYSRVTHSQLATHPVGSTVTVHDSWLFPDDDFVRSVDNLEDSSMPAFVAFLITFAFAVFSYLLIWRRPLQDRWLARYGKPARGMIHDKYLTTGNKGAKIFHVTYHFDGNNRPWVQSMTVSQSEYHSISKGQPVTVLYNPVNPAVSTVYSFSRYRALP